jgi:DNA-directed RNA polymerase specialized sigma24 family protein
MQLNEQPTERTIVDRLDRIEALLAELLRQRKVKEWYSTAEIAELLGRAEFTVREWCRNGRVNCRKQGGGRGKYQAWVISHEELLRIQRDWLLPLPKCSTQID